MPGAYRVVAAAFNASLQRQLEHPLHSLRVFLVATQVAEPQTIGLERYAWWIRGMHGNPTLMLHSNGSHSFNRDFQGRTVGKRGGVIAVAVMKSWIEHVAAIAVVGKTLAASCLCGLDPHRAIADRIRGSLVMVVEEINQGHQHRLALLLFKSGSSTKAAGGQESLGRRALHLGPMTRLERRKGSRHVG